jgi:heme-degrading monooxygenase HmoA
MPVHRVPMVMLFCAAAAPSDVKAALDEIAEAFQVSGSDPVEWHFPSTDGCRVIASVNDKVPDDYAPAQRELVHAEVGVPSAVVTLILNRRPLNEACDGAKSLAVHLLGKFYGVADDCSGDDRIWNLGELRDATRQIKFLDCYRENRRGVIEIIWTYRVHPERVAEFQRFYNSDGVWAALFRRAPEYRGTTLLRDQDDPLRFATVDCWDSLHAFEAFMDKHKAEYEQIDAACARFTTEETRIGSFERQ